MRTEDFLRRHAANSPERTALVYNGMSYTYGCLYDMASKRAGTLRREGRGVSVFRSTQDADFFINYFGAHMAGAVAVPLAGDCPEALILETEESLEDFPLPEDAADILYTTGTTGKAKGVIISHRAICADADNLIEAQGYTPDLTFIITGPLNHIGSLSKVWPVIRMGGTLHVLDGMKDINAFFGALDAAPGKAATFLVPASIRMLLLFSADRLGKYKDKTDFVETGGAPITEGDMTRLCRILPESRLYNTYASTEAGIISTYEYSKEGCLAGCVGRAMKHSSVEISFSGGVVCRGGTLMSGYTVDDYGTGAVLDDGALYTSDVGAIDDTGCLHLMGRNDDVINIGGYKVVPEEVEAAAMRMKGIEDCICIAVSHPVTGAALKLLVVAKDGAKISGKAVAEFLKSKLETYKVPAQYQFVEEIKRTFNGKLDRKAYN